MTHCLILAGIACLHNGNSDDIGMITETTMITGSSSPKTPQWTISNVPDAVEREPVGSELSSVIALATKQEMGTLSAF